MSDKEIKIGVTVLLVAIVLIFILAAQGGNDGPLTPVDVPTSVEE